MPRIVQAAEAVLAALAAATLYRALYGELPYHDVSRFVNQVNSGRFVWDIAHIFMQPVTLLWHEYLGLGEAAETSQKHINTFATAVGVGIFYALLQRLNIPRWERLFATVLVMVSGSLITLAPSGHMKLLAFPFVNAALYILVGWERAGTCGDARPNAGLVRGAGILAVASSFLVSAIPTAPFAVLGVLLARLREKDGALKALASAVLFGVVFGVTFLLLACAGYAAFTGNVPSVAGLTNSITDKADLKPAGYGLLPTLARLVFGSVGNLILAPDLGSVSRAWLTGEVPALMPYTLRLISQGAPSLVTLVLLVAIYVRSIMAMVSGERCIMPMAFLCGAQTWTIYYGLNDPEHWYMLTVPTVLLFVMLFPVRFVRVVLPLWAILAALINVVVFAVPYATYPLQYYKAEFGRVFSVNDLLISFVAFSGKPSLAAMDIQDVPTVMLDEKLRSAPDLRTFFVDRDQDVSKTFARHGRVVVFGGVLDPNDWNAPWSELPARGVTKQVMLDFFQSHYRVQSLGSLGEIPAWEITPRSDR